MYNKLSLLVQRAFLEFENKLIIIGKTEKQKNI